MYALHVTSSSEWMEHDQCNINMGLDVDIKTKYTKKNNRIRWKEPKYGPKETQCTNLPQYNINHIYIQFTTE
jgi:hypothetical protein